MAFRYKVSYQIKYYMVILIIAVVASVVGGYYSTKLKLESDIAKLLPQSYESVKALERIKTEVGGTGNIRVAIESRDFQRSKAFADSLVARIEQNPNFNYIDYKNDITFYNKNALLFLEQEQLDSLKQAVEDKIDAEKQKLNPLFVEDLFGEDDEIEPVDLQHWEQRYESKRPKEYHTNADSSVLVLDIYPAGTNTSLQAVQFMLTEIRKMVDEIDPRRFDPEMQVLYGGNFKNALDEYRVVKRDILGTAYLGFTGVFLLILLYFRRFSATILIIVALLMSLTWTFGLTYFVIGNLNTITGFLFVILFGLGIDYGIHALSRYSESRKNGMTVEQALEVLITQTARSLATSAFTTAAAFFSLLLMDFRGFAELGFISGTGIIFALIAMTVVLPCLIIVAEKTNFLKFKPSKILRQDFQGKRFPFPRSILLTAILLTFFSAVAIFRVQFEYDFTNLRAEVPEKKEFGEKTRGIFELSESPAIAIGDSKQDVDEIVAAVKEIIKNDTLSPTVKTVRSVYALVPEDQPQKIKTIAEIKILVDENADVLKGKDRELVERFKGYLEVKEPFTLKELPENVKRQFINKQGELGDFAFIYPRVALRDGKNAMAFRDDIGRFTTASGKQIYTSSSNIIFADMLTLMIQEGRLAIALTFGVVFLIVLLDFRNLKETILVLTPLVLGVLWMFGSMFLLGMKLNFFNMVVLPSIIGIGVDHGVHIYHRYKEEGAGSLLHLLRFTGAAITMCALTTLMGYSGLITAQHPGLNSIGDLAIIGVSLTFITAMVILPALLQNQENRKNKPKAQTEITEDGQA